MTKLFPESEDDFLSTKKAKELFPESEDEEDNAVCTDIASRDEVGRKVSRDELGREESVSPTPEAEELANSMFDFQSTLTTFVDSTVAHEEHLTSRLDKQLEMIWLLQQQVEDTIKKYPVATKVTKDTFFVGASPVITKEQIDYIKTVVDEFFKVGIK